MISGTGLVKSTDGSYESREGREGHSSFGVSKESICLSASVRANDGEAKQLQRASLTGEKARQERGSCVCKDSGTLEEQKASLPG